MPAMETRGSRARRPLERRQEFAAQRTRRSQGPRAHEQNSRPHAMPQLFFSERHARAVRPARLRLRENEPRRRRENRIDDAGIHPRPRKSRCNRDSDRLPPRSAARRTRSCRDGDRARHRSDCRRHQVRQAAPVRARCRAQTLRLDARAADLLLSNFRRRNRRPPPPNPGRRSKGHRETRGAR